MKLSNNLLTKYSLVLVIILPVFASYAQNFNAFNSNVSYRLTPERLGESKSLDIVNDNKNNALVIVDTGDLSGQYSKIETIEESPQEVQSNNSKQNILRAGATLFKGNSLISPNNIYKLKFQSDGNLAFYGVNDRYIWDSKTAGQGVSCKLKRNGNLVIYDNYNTIVWSSKTIEAYDKKYGTSEWRPVRLVVKNTGFCGLKSDTGREVWSCSGNMSYTNINEKKITKLLLAGKSISKGTRIVSPNNKYKLKFQADGNLAFYGPNDRYIWDAKTAGKGETCILQEDGNLVVYDKDNTAVWSTETTPYFNQKYSNKDWKPVRLVVKDSGFCGLKSETGRNAWFCNK